MVMSLTELVLTRTMMDQVGPKDTHADCGGAPWSLRKTHVPAQCHDWAGPQDTHLDLRGDLRKKQTQGTGREGTIMLSNIWCIWGKRIDRMVHFMWTEAYPKRFKWWGAGRGGWPHCHPGTWWCLGLSCCPGPCLGSWPWYSHSLCWSPSLDNAKGRKCRAVQICSLLLTVLTLGRIDSAPHQVNHSGETVLYFTWAAQ